MKDEKMNIPYAIAEDEKKPNITYTPIEEEKQEETKPFNSVQLARDSRNQAGYNSREEGTFYNVQTAKLFRQEAVKKGYSPDTINKYIEDNTQLSIDNVDIEKVVAGYRNQYERTSTLAKSFTTHFTQNPEDIKDVENKAGAVNQRIIDRLTAEGLNAKVSDFGEVFVDVDGAEIPVEGGFLRSLEASKGEIGGAIAGGIVGGKVGAVATTALLVALGVSNPIGWIAGAGVLLGGVIGGAIGAGVGAGADSIANLADTKEDLDVELLASKMGDAAVWDAVGGLATGGALKGSKMLLKSKIVSKLPTTKLLKFAGAITKRATTSNNHAVKEELVRQGLSIGEADLFVKEGLKKGNKEIIETLSKKIPQEVWSKAGRKAFTEGDVKTLANVWTDTSKAINNSVAKNEVSIAELIELNKETAKVVGTNSDSLMSKLPKGKKTIKNEWKLKKGGYKDIYIRDTDNYVYINSLPKNLTPQHLMQIVEIVDSELDNFGDMPTKIADITRTKQLKLKKKWAEDALYNSIKESDMSEKGKNSLYREIRKTSKIKRDWEETVRNPIYKHILNADMPNEDIAEAIVKQQGKTGGSLQNLLEGASSTLRENIENVIMRTRMNANTFEIVKGGAVYDFANLNREMGNFKFVTPSLQRLQEQIKEFATYDLGEALLKSNASKSGGKWARYAMNLSTRKKGTKQTALKLFNFVYNLRSDDVFRSAKLEKKLSHFFEGDKAFIAKEMEEMKKLIPKEKLAEFEGIVKEQRKNYAEEMIQKANAQNITKNTDTIDAEEIKDITNIDITAKVLKNSPYVKRQIWNAGYRFVQIGNRRIDLYIPSEETREDMKAINKKIADTYR